MKVIDASALASFLMKEKGWQEVGEVLRKGTLSLDLVLKEASNVVLKRFRRGEMSEKEVDAALQALRTLVGNALKVEGRENILRRPLRLP